jgi:hypothetical protein
LVNSFHLKTHHATDTETTMKIIASLECQNIEPNAPKTPKTPWKTRTGSNTVIARITISIAIQSTALMNNFMAQFSNSKSVGRSDAKSLTSVARIVRSGRYNFKRATVTLIIKPIYVGLAQYGFLALLKTVGTKPVNWIATINFLWKRDTPHLPQAVQACLRSSLEERATNV